MTARLSIEPPVASAGSWPTRRPPSSAVAAAHAALKAQARRTAHAMIKDSARRYALRPHLLDAIDDRLSALLPGALVQRLAKHPIPLWRHFGTGGEIPAINIRGARLYARWSRAIASRNARRAV